MVSQLCRSAPSDVWRELNVQAMAKLALAILQITLSVALVGLMLPAVVSHARVVGDGRLGFVIVATAIGTIFIVLRYFWSVLARRR